MTNHACSISFRLLIRGIPLFLIASHGAHAAGAARDWRAQWESTIQAAKKEGQVTIYSTSGATVKAESFQRQFPEIKFVNFNYPAGGHSPAFGRYFVTR